MGKVLLYACSVVLCFPEAFLAAARDRSLGLFNLSSGLAQQVQCSLFCWHERRKKNPNLYSSQSQALKSPVVSES